MLVEIRPLDIERWHGKKLKDGLRTNIKTKISALVNTATMQYNVKLTDKEKDFFKKELGMEFNTNFTGEPHPVWDGALGRVELKSSSIFLNPDDIAIDKLKFKICQGSKYVANSFQDLQQGLYPEATHVIVNEKEEVEAKAVKLEIRNKAIAELSKLSAERKLQLILILTGKDFKDKSPSFVDVELDNLISKQPDVVLHYMKQDKEDLSNNALVVAAMAKGVLRNIAGQICYFDEPMATSVEDMATLLKDPAKQELKLRIISQTNE